MFYLLEFYADISELNARMETVEGTVSEHDARLSTIDTTIEGNNNLHCQHQMKYLLSIVFVVLENCQCKFWQQTS